MRWAFIFTLLVVIGCDVRDQPAEQAGESQSVDPDPQVVEPEPDTGTDDAPFVLLEDVPDWPIYRGDAAMTGYVDTAWTGQLKLQWTFETGEPIVSSAVIADGVVFIGSNNGNVYAIKLNTGARIWSYTCGTIDAPTEVEAPPLVLGDRVYVGSTDGVMHALNRKTGEQVWSVTVEDKIVGSANSYTTADGRVLILFGSYDAKVYAVDAGTGEQVWAFSTEDYVNGGPAVSDDIVAFGGCDGQIYALDAADGTVRSKVEIGHPNSGTVALKNGHALIGHYGNAFVSVNLNDSNVAWTYERRDFPFFSGAATDGKVVVFGGRDRDVHCVKLDTGEPVWQYDAGGKVDSSPVIVGDRVIVGSDDGRLHMMSLESGQAIQSYDVGESIVSSPAVAGPWVVIGSEDGNVYAFTDENDHE